MQVGDTVRVVAFSGKEEAVLTDEGESFPITNWFNSDGDECLPEDAVAFVAGVEGRWFALKLADFEGATVQ